MHIFPLSCNATSNCHTMETIDWGAQFIDSGLELEECRKGTVGPRYFYFPFDVCYIYMVRYTVLPVKKVR